MRVFAWCRYLVQKEGAVKIKGQRVNTVKRAPTQDEIKRAKRVTYLFEARLTMRDGQVVEGWFWCEGTSWRPGEPVTGPFETEEEAAEHADEHGGMVQ
jgi:hypothetical protein